MHSGESAAQRPHPIAPPVRRPGSRLSYDLGEKAGEFREIPGPHAVARHLLGAHAHSARGGKARVVVKGLGIGDDVVLLEEGGEAFSSRAGASQQHLVGGGEVERRITFQDQTFFPQRTGKGLRVRDHARGIDVLEFNHLVGRAEQSEQSSEMVVADVAGKGA